MNFDLTDEQRMFRDVVRDFVRAEVAPLARHTDETGEFNWTAVTKMGPLVGFADTGGIRRRRSGYGLRFHRD